MGDIGCTNPLARQHLDKAMSIRLKPPASNGDGPSADQPPLSVAIPINVRSASLALIALIALIVFLRWAQDVLIPITLAVLLSYALTPVIDWLKRRAKLHKAV